MNKDNFRVHDKRRLKFSSPEGLKEKLIEYPLTRDFIDSIANQGFKICYRNDDFGSLGVVNYGIKEIWINAHKRPTEIDLTLVHELIHLAVSFSPIIYESIEYEKIIDKIAEVYTKDKDFMDYIKKTIKIQTS